MDWMPILTMMGMTGGMFIFFMKRLDRRFDKIDVELKEMRKDITNIDKRLTVVESILARVNWFNGFTSNVHGEQK